MGGALMAEQVYVEMAGRELVEGAIMSGNYLRGNPDYLFDTMFNVQDLDLPIIFAYSEAFMPTPRDWPTDNIMVVGRIKMPASAQKDKAEKGGSYFGDGLQQACVDFIAAGTPPVYIGWGSMTVSSGEFMGQLAVG